MKSYVMDEISPPDMKALRAFLKENTIASEVEGIFWVPLPEDLLSDIQFQHRRCRPHVFAVELGVNWIKLEFFIRSLAGMRCRCQAYCTPQQRDFVLRFADGRLVGEDINERRLEPAEVSW